jgi:group II intron reverse transcriptase/maturase
LGNLSTPIKLQKLQAALHAKAKEEPEYRFYALYDKVYREDVLAHAYACCKTNGGAAGVDAERFEDIEAYGVDRWLGELAQALRNRVYQPQAVRRVYIPKPNSTKKRPLGIPPICDRVVETAALLILAPIFETDLQPEQYAYRPGRSALSAVKQVHSLLNTGHTEVIEGDLSGYFDSIPHAELLTSVARRVSDRHLLHLVKMWLTTPVEETDERGGKQRSTQNRDNKRGTPQGSPISTLLANLYMRRFVLGWKSLGCETRFHARIVNYADDFVICCKRQAAEAMTAMRGIMGRLKLTVNEDKTRICRLPDGSFDFLGYNFGRCYSTKTGRPYLGTRPSKKSIKHILEAVHMHTARSMDLLDATEVVQRLNWALGGWANYFQLGPVTQAYRFIDAYTTRRLRRWLCRKHKHSGAGWTRYPDEYLYQTLGLIRLPISLQRLPWAKA